MSVAEFASAKTETVAKRLTAGYERGLSALKHFDGLGPLALRLYLGPIFVLAGWKKLTDIDSTIQWFANPDWGLGLPMPELLAWLASLSEFVGGLALLLGLGVRFFSVPLMVTMIVAAVTVHWPYGWQAIADPSWLYANERVNESAVRLARAKEILQEYGNYAWLTARGNFVILNNGIEFSITYFVMLLALLFTGGGRYVSADYWIARRLRAGRTS
ncbi:DoxX family protein [Aestuariicella hydrocarbonica]|uniref:DoxX family protein n=1 Tax=Pseudomaricurvus hydrocarbonicus TaxID=1470433 RepID=A0A9E5MJ13_9GAMM|nr:DoxX family protein [Aestuariicella hydrocarbonica]